MILKPITNLRFHFHEAEARFFVDMKIEGDSLHWSQRDRGNHSRTHVVQGVSGKIFNPECLAKQMKLGIAEARRRNKEEKEQKSVTCFCCYFVPYLPNRTG